MEDKTTAFLILFLTVSLIGVTGYASYVAFGPDSLFFKDPFEEHEE
nr:photosystem II protein N [Meringosphaera mediterranea]